MARPKKDIDEQQVIKLAMINCSYAEIADIVGCDESTLTRRFAQAIQLGRSKGRMSLKRMMFEKCEEGSVPMMIWMSKQLLGYTEKVEQKNESSIIMKEEDRNKALQTAKDILTVVNANKSKTA